MANGDNLELGAINNNATSQTLLAVAQSFNAGFSVAVMGNGSVGDPVTGISGEAVGSVNAVGVKGGTTDGVGVLGQSNGIGVVGNVTNQLFDVQDEGKQNVGVLGMSTSGVGIRGESSESIGVLGKSTQDVGVRGEGDSQDGVQGFSDIRNGVYGQSGSESDIKDGKGKHDAAGILGWSWVNYGVWGMSLQSNDGVRGESGSGYGVHGISLPGSGVAGESKSGIGVDGFSNSGNGVHGKSLSGPGVSGESNTGSYGVRGLSTIVGVLGVQSSTLTFDVPPEGPAKSVKPTKIGVYGYSHDQGIGVRGRAEGAGSGVDGRSVSGTGVQGSSSTGYGAQFYGGRAPLRLEPSTTIGAPTAGSHKRGEFFVDATGDLLYCKTDGTPGQWFKVTLGPV